MPFISPLCGWCEHRSWGYRQTPIEAEEPGDEICITQGVILGLCTAHQQLFARAVKGYFVDLVFSLPLPPREADKARSKAEVMSLDCIIGLAWASRARLS